MAKTVLLPPSAMSSKAVAIKSEILGPNYTQIPGSASYAAATPDGSLWVLSTQPAGPDKYIWHYVNGGWQNLPGLAARLSVSPSDILYAINSGGGAYAYRGSWTALGGGASDIAAAVDDSVYVLSNGNATGTDQAIWHYAANAWTQVPGAGTSIVASWDPNSHTVPNGAVSANGLYVLNSAGSIYHQNTDNSFVQLPGQASAIAATTTGNIYALGYPAGASGTGSALYSYDLDSPGWAAQPGAGVSLSTDSSLVLFIVASSGNIYSTPVVQTTPTPLPNFPINNAGLVATAGPAPPMSFIDYSAPGNGYSISTAADGTIYVTQTGSTTIVKISGSAVTNYAMPAAYRSPGFIVRGSDGAQWFSNQMPGPPNIVAAMGRLDAAGNFTEYNTPQYINGAPFGLLLGPDGNVWFTEFYEGRIGRVTPGGAFSEYSLGYGTHRPSGLALGPDGNLWIAESANATIEKMSPAGVLLGTYPTGGVLAFHLTSGPDGAMWFVDAHNVIGRIDMQGHALSWYLPCDVPNVGNFCWPGYFEGDTDIVLGPDGNLWFTAQNFQAIARLTVSTGQLVEWPVPSGGPTSASPYSMTVFGNTILSVGGGNRIVRITP